MNRDRFVRLPCEGAKFISCVFQGNGKDGEIGLKVEGHPLIVIPTGQFSIANSSGVDIQFRSMDDSNVELSIKPKLDFEVILKEIRVDLSYYDELPEELFKGWDSSKTWVLNYVVPVRLEFEAVAGLRRR
jgi:hypothetical protein